MSEVLDGWHVMFQRDSLNFLHSYTTKTFSRDENASSSLVAEASYFWAFSAAENGTCTKRKAVLVPGKDCRVFQRRAAELLAGTKEQTEPVNSSSSRQYCLTGSLAWSPASAALPLFPVFLSAPKYSLIMGNANRKKLQCGITEIPTKFELTVCAHRHEHINCGVFFLWRAVLSQSALWNPLLDHTHVQKATGFGFFPCLLTLTHRKNYCSYETAKIIKTIKQLHSCDVLSFLLLLLCSLTHRFTKFSSW